MFLRQRRCQNHDTIIVSLQFSQSEAVLHSRDQSRWSLLRDPHFSLAEEFSLQLGHSQSSDSIRLDSLFLAQCQTRCFSTAVAVRSKKAASLLDRQTRFKSKKHNFNRTLLTLLAALPVLSPFCTSSIC